MGNVCTDNNAEAERRRNEEREREKKKSHLVEVDQKEIVLAKLMVQRDRFEGKIREQDSKEEMLKRLALEQAQEKRREEAMYTLKKIKRIKQFRKNLRNKLEFIDRQVDNIENAMDDVSFTNTLRESNKVLDQLNKEIDMEEIVIAKELQEEGKMRREELDALLDDEDDDELRDELNEIEAQILGENLEDIKIEKSKKRQKKTTKEVSDVDRELEAILA